MLTLKVKIQIGGGEEDEEKMHGEISEFPRWARTRSRSKPLIKTPRAKMQKRQRPKQQRPSRLGCSYFKRQKRDKRVIVDSNDDVVRISSSSDEDDDEEWSSSLSFNDDDDDEDYTEKKRKQFVYECSYCNRVFSCGQALGGHKGHCKNQAKDAQCKQLLDFDLNEPPVEEAEEMRPSFDLNEVM